MTPRIVTGTSRRYQTPRAISRRVLRAYGAMGRLADRTEARSRGGHVEMLLGPAYQRWLRARAHALLCTYGGSLPYRLTALSDDGREVEVDPIMQAAE